MCARRLFVRLRMGRGDANDEARMTNDEGMTKSEGERDFSSPRHKDTKEELNTRKSEKLKGRMPDAGRLLIFLDRINRAGWIYRFCSRPSDLAPNPTLKGSS